MANLYLGMISGTSTDGVDAVLVDVDGTGCRLVAATTQPYPDALRSRVQEIISNPETSLLELGHLDAALGQFFAACALHLIDDAHLKPADIRAIGHHGQTIFHHPVGAEPFTLQIGDPNIVTARTGIDTVADFRRLDIAHGGQGAPLVPAFHDWMFRAADEARVVLNIGGIANITVLEPGMPTTGFDTGPGNTLLDAWIQKHLSLRFDEAGQWAAGGRVRETLLAACLDEPYFALRPPKSTGRELFNLPWLKDKLGHCKPRCSARDVQTTLAQLTAETIARSIDDHAPGCARILVCGGGSHNNDLMARLATSTGLTIETTDAYGLPSDWIEGAAFAWLAHARLQGLTGNVPSVTGARKAVLLGGVYSE